MPLHADREHGAGAAPASCPTARRSLLDAATAQVYSVAVLPHGRIVSGSDDTTLKVWVDYAKMAGLVALRRTPENYDWRLIGRLIAKFL